MPAATAKDRLAENGRTCDGCGEVILRWTTACLFLRGRAYGSTCGCAAECEEVGPCEACGETLDAWLDYGGVCTTCRYAGADLPEGFSMAGAPDGLDKETKEWLSAGPLVLVATPYGNYWGTFPSETRPPVVVASSLPRCAKWTAAANRRRV